MKTAIEMAKEADAYIYIHTSPNDPTYTWAEYTFTKDELETLLAIHKEAVLDEIRAQGAEAYHVTADGASGSIEVLSHAKPTDTECSEHALTVLPLYALPEKEKAK